MAVTARSSALRNCCRNKIGYVEHGSNQLATVEQSCTVAEKFDVANIPFDCYGLQSLDNGRCTQRKNPCPAMKDNVQQMDDVEVAGMTMAETPNSTVATSPMAAVPTITIALFKKTTFYYV